MQEYTLEQQAKEALVVEYSRMAETLCPFDKTMCTSKCYNFRTPRYQKDERALPMYNKDLPAIYIVFSAGCKYFDKINQGR